MVSTCSIRSSSLTGRNSRVETRGRVAAFVEHDNYVRLHSALGYIARQAARPIAKVAG